MPASSKYADMKPSERINHIIDTFCGGNANEFARRTGINKSAISTLRKGAWDDRGIGTYAERIARAFPRVNCRWLLTGNGKPGGRDVPPADISQKLDMILRRLPK